eukprot:CAMPEP_0172170956 /NCGR_PEP_ID=MMETSP1050-20130122/11618_1 /TAXON_ID=233186 /ORGANISM="Cryptomonas curvata, Strain CCAP979/52" /LENGTH=924 /DNA_ID=CAMNT_0012842321 /DNA_START=324 /DNA_END=3094 /DNA_ORIENTATION=+
MWIVGRGNRVEGSATKQRFALQLYSRLTNANPELVLVFMQAGSVGAKQEDGKDDPVGSKGGEATPSGHGLRTSGAHFGQEEAGVSSITSTGSKGAVNSATATRASAAASRAKGGGITQTKKLGRSKSPERLSTMGALSQFIEKVTGFDLDGDGTVGGDIMSEEEDLDMTGSARKTKFSRLSWGLEIWDLLHCAVELVYEPELQKQRLTVIAARFFGYGCKSSHLKTIGMGLQGVLGEMLVVHCKTPWGPAESAAWDWFWGDVEAAMSLTIEAYERGVSEKVHADWEAIRVKHKDAEFGDIFYAEIKSIAPDFLQLFVRPKALQYSTFIDQMDMLVGFAAGPEAFYEQIKPLAIRHMKYGVSAQMIKGYETVVMNVLKRTLGEQFNEESQQAWHYVWINVSRCIADCLSVGSNLVTMALVAGEVPELERALSLAPRGQRADWITRVQIHDSVISPLYWAVRDGMLDMARVMIRDLLAMRADREAYYYGYDQLWAVHPDIVAVLCRICPDLLEDLFDGMLWHSATVEDGDQVRVNYYLRELLGDPAVYADAWDTPFGVLALHGPTGVFEHPLVTKALDLKWRRFGMRWFLALEGWYTLVFVAFEVAFVGYDQHDCASSSLRVGVGAMAAATFVGQTLLVMRQVRAGQVGPVSIWGYELSLPRWLHKRFNCVRLGSMALLGFVGLFDPCLFLVQDLLEAQEAAAAGGEVGGLWINPGSPLARINIVGAIVAILLCLGAFQFCILSHKLSAFMFTIGTLVSDVSRVIVVVVLLTLAFGTALTRVEGNAQGTGPFSTLSQSLFTLVRKTLQLDPPDMNSLSPVGWLLFLLYAFSASIGMLNILVAQLDQNVHKLARLTECYAIQDRVHVTLEVESTLSQRTRQQIWEELAFDEPLDYEQGYAGPAGGIQCLEPATIMMHPKYIKDRVQR